MPNENSDTWNVSRLNDYIEEMGWKPLNDREQQKGKSELRIYGTQQPMPWNTIYTRLASGQPIQEVCRQYGHGRKLCMWAQLDAVTLDLQTKDAVDQEVTARNAMVKVISDAEDPENTARTLLDRVNESCPDFQTNVALFADKLLRKAISKLDDKFLEAADMEKLANAVQKSTDIVGVTQRHSNAASITNTKIEVSGFAFPSVDLPPPTNKTYTIEELDAMTLDAEVEDLTPLEAEEATEDSQEATADV